MKKSLAAAVAAGLMFATAANAQEEAPNTDFDKIDACFNSIKGASAVTATEKPALSLTVYVNSKVNDAFCGMTLQGDADSASAETQFVFETFATIGNNSYRLNGDNTSSNYSVSVAHEGATYKATPIAGVSDMHIEIVAPANAFPDSMEALQEDAAAGKISLTIKDDVMTIDVPKGEVQDWMPEYVSDNILAMLVGSMKIVQVLDSEELAQAAEKSAMTSTSVILPPQP